MSATLYTKDSYRSYMHSTIAAIALLKAGKINADPSIADMLSRSNDIVMDLTARQQQAQESLQSHIERVERAQSKAFAHLQEDLASQEQRLSLLETAGQDLHQHIDTQTTLYDEASKKRKDLTLRLENLSQKAAKDIADPSWLHGAAWAARTVSFPVAAGRK